MDRESFFHVFICGIHELVDVPRSFGRMEPLPFSFGLLREMTKAQTYQGQQLRFRTYDFLFDCVFELPNSVLTVPAS